MLKRLKILIVSFLVGCLTLLAEPALGAEPSMAEYTSYPIFQLSTVEPNIMIILDNSKSMNLQAHEGAYDHNTKYYGYFEPYKRYRYGSNIFERDTNGAWDGNFLNWLSMRRIDVARKVLMGGLATSRQGTGNQTNIGETPDVAGYDFAKTFTDTAADLTPFDSGLTKTYLVADGNFYVDGNTYVIRVDKDMNTHPDEAYNFVDGNIAGVLQSIADKARWGNMFFNFGTGSNQSGGYVASTIGTNMESLITDLQNTHCDTWTPLAETYYVAVQYFKQEDVESGLDYPNNAVPNANLGDDPFYNGTEFVHCAKSFVLLITDGHSTMDLMIPNYLKDVDGDSNDPGSYPDYGSNHLDDIALYARTTDLRSATVGKSDLEGEQNLILYTIYAFGNDPDAESLLQDASKNGGFVEKNGTKGPDLQAEWDANNDGEPDTYYKADNGYELETQILAAVNDILERAASGTAVSVLSTSNEGEGNLVQAYYRPVVTKDTTEYKWIGFLQSLWVDPNGYLREDTDGDLALDVEVDAIVTYFVDPGSGDTRIKRFAVDSANPYPDLETAPYSLLDLDQMSPIWEAGKSLAQRLPIERRIFTFIDKDGDGLVDEDGVTGDPFDNSEEVIQFNTGTASLIKPYLGVKDDAAWAYLGANHDDRTSNLIDYIRGEDLPGLRPRKIDGSNVWKLADIVNSSPVSIAKPPENYHIIYSDESYQKFYEAFKNRETMVYVGANDGMLHAFTSWEYDSTTNGYIAPAGAPVTENIGDELWAYVPQSLLPHLKWFPSPDYTHVYYVDLKPKLFDAKILDDDAHYVDADTEPNWGTILLVGLNMGGKNIQVLDDFDYDSGTPDETRDFYPTYICLDVTDPRNPRLLWERTYTDLQMSTSIPAVVKVKERWFAVFGSGPSDYDATSPERGHVFVVDLKTGNPYKSGSNDWLFETGESNAFMTSPASVDKDLNFSVDAIYFGEAYPQGGNWRGKLYKLTVPWVDALGNYDGSDLLNYVDDPKDPVHPWQLSALFAAPGPITAGLALSRDDFGNVWVYAGTGRYFSTPDKTNADPQYLFGLKDPFFNKDHTPAGLYGDDYYHNYGSSLELQVSDLFDADPYVVTTDGQVYESGTNIGTWEDLLALVEVNDGWIRSLGITKERVLEKPSILGGILYSTSFVPNSDVCGFGGDSYLYGLYYETGTAFFKPVFDDGIETINIDGEDKDKVKDKADLGAGKASSVGIHIGVEKGATGFVQQSTGRVVTKGLDPAFNTKSGLRCWREK